MQTDRELKRRKHAPLPAIIRNPTYFKDTYENSFLMTFDLKRQTEDKLKKILLVYFLIRFWIIKLSKFFV